MNHPALIRRWIVLFSFGLALAACTNEPQSSSRTNDLLDSIKQLAAVRIATPTITVDSAPNNPPSQRPASEVVLGRAVHAAIAPNGTLLAVTTSTGIALVELPSMRMLRFNAILDGGNEVAFSSNGALLAVSVGGNGSGAATQLRRTVNGTILASVDGDKPRFSRDGQTLVTDMSYDGGAIAVLWNANDGSRIGSISGELATFSPDDQFIAMVQIDRATQQPFTQLWRVEDGKKIARVDGTDPVFSPNGLLLTTATEKNVRLWDIATSKPVHTLGSSVTSNNPQLTSFSADGKQLLTTTDYDLQVWNVADGSRSSRIKNAALWDQPRDVDGPRLFGPHGATLAVFAPPIKGQISGMRLVRTSDGKEIFKDDAARTITFTPDGALAATVDLNGQVQIIRTRDGSAMTFALPSFSTIVSAPKGEMLPGTNANG